jgi:hypothetical protein
MWRLEHFGHLLPQREFGADVSTGLECPGTVPATVGKADDYLPKPTCLGFVL